MSISKDTKLRVTIALTSESAAEELLEAIQEGSNDDLADNFAKKDLSNLTATSIPDGVDIESVSASSFSFKTEDKATGNSGQVNVFSGNNTGTGTTGIVDIASGDILNVASSNNTGIAGLRSGETNGSGNTGNVNIYSGNNIGSGVSGNITISAGTTAANDATTGSVEISSGFPLGVSDSGTVSIHSSNSSKNSGIVNIYSGDATGGDSGNINLYSGSASSARGGINLYGGVTRVRLDSSVVTGLNGFFEVTNNTGSSRLQIVHDEFGVNDSTAIRIFDSGTVNGFAITGFSQENTNGGSFNFTSTRVYATSDGSYVAGDFNIKAASTEAYLVTASNTEISSGNINIETQNSYISGTGANANTGNINLTTGTPQGTGTRGNINVSSRFFTLQDSTRFVIEKNSSDILARFQIDNGGGNYGQLFFNRLPSTSDIYIGAMESAIDQNGAPVRFAGAWSMSDTNGVYKGSDVYLYTNSRSGFRDAPNVSVSSGDIFIQTNNGFVQGSYTDANSGNITLSTGSAQGSGTKGNVNINAKAIYLGTPIQNDTLAVTYDGAMAPLVVARQQIIITNPSGSNYAHLQFTDNNYSNFYVIGNSTPANQGNIGTWSSSGQSGGVTNFHGPMVRGNTDGSFTSGAVFLETRGASGYEETADNLEISSGNLTIRTSDSFIKGTGVGANTGNITLQTGAAQGSGTKGYILLNGSFISANSAQIKNIADGTDPQDAVSLSQLNAKTRAGSVSIPNASNTVTVTFSSDIGTSNYSVNLQIQNTIDASPLFLDKIITSQSSTGFTVKFSQNTDSANYNLQYVAQLFN